MCSAQAVHERSVEQVLAAFVHPRTQVRQNHGGGGAVADAPGSEASRDKIPFSTRRRPTDERRAIHGSIVLIDPAIFDGTSFEIIRQPVLDILKIFALLIDMARRE